VFDHWVTAGLVPLAVWIVLSGLDDLFIGLVRLLRAGDRFPWPSESALDLLDERPIAVFVPLWNEHAVIGRMLDRNLAAIRYRDYRVFAGVYPNDEPTTRAVEDAAGRHDRVEVAHCPRSGPTSKGDCLNSIYLEMLEYERRNGVRFQVMVIHDAEDVIHPDSLRLINWFSREYDMVQIPVLPLPTSAGEFTHGIYCDEFAEFQSKDIPVRRMLGGFLPSNGVGTGFSRDAMERLAAQRGGPMFAPECLTEDYETGYELHKLGCPQIFVPLRRDGAGPVATREYFPRRWRAAVRQRSRWVAGIALQAWQRHGWRTTWRQRYWFARDRKGLIGNLLTPLAALALVHGLLGWRTSGGTHPVWLAYLYCLTLPITVAQAAMRIGFSARIYGWRFAAAAPLRMLWGNLVNYAATLAAVRQFAQARRLGRSLAWRKTQHVYPAHQPADSGRPRIGEMLVRLRVIESRLVDWADANRPEGSRLGEFLVRAGFVSEDDLYRALSEQAGVPLGPPPAADVDPLATRLLPASAVRRFHVLPYRVDLGQLHLATDELPSEKMTRNLAAFSTLPPRFRLVSPREFDRLADRYLPQHPR